MLYQITDATVSVAGKNILNHIQFEIKGTEKIAIVGRNGAGKTTLLHLISGELTPDRDDKRKEPAIIKSRALTIGILQQLQKEEELASTIEQLLLSYCPVGDTYEQERYQYEMEYDRLFTGFGFTKEDKSKKLSMFSGGEQTKIALIQLLLQKPDILLLDEPTNHLDIATVEWLEQYMRDYKNAVVMVSHDRFFLNKVVDVVYELSNGKLTRYVGDYTSYREEKQKRIARQKKAYERQQEEIRQQEELIARFKHKANKAAFARSRKKMLDRMIRMEEPEKDEVSIFTGDIIPLELGSKNVFEAEHLKVGYDKVLYELSFRLQRGQKIAILGENGAGKSTLLKTIAGQLDSLGGKYRLGNNVALGYFDQNSAAIDSEKCVLEHFHDLFPSLTEKEIRSILGAYLFKGVDTYKKVQELSGGERARLVLAELMQSRPNFLVLDEPTNHCDIQTKETLESAFRAYRGSILFVSHDRYFVKQIADAILLIQNQQIYFYPFGYEHYLERLRNSENGDVAAQRTAQEQLLISGLKEVPMAEKHRLKEISTEEAYLDWRFRPVREKLEQVENRVEQLELEIAEAKKQLYENQMYWEQACLKDADYKTAESNKDNTNMDNTNIGNCNEADSIKVDSIKADSIKADSIKTSQYKRYEYLQTSIIQLQHQLEEETKEWHRCCLSWYDIWLETVDESEAKITE